MNKQNFMTLYAYQAMNANCEQSIRYGTLNEHESMTQQADAMETDINFIMKQYQTTGMVNAVLQEGIYGDFTDIPDYATALQRIRAADEAFQTVPAKIREQFNNDPGEFIEFAQNPDNYDKLVELGLAKKIEKPDTTPEPTPPPVPPVPKVENEGKN